jgi:cytochrome c peroxidase
MRPAILLLAAAIVAGCASRGPATPTGEAVALNNPPLPGSSPAIAAIGRKMFFDSSLSASGKLACATCHDPRYAYGPPPGRAIALGGRRMDQTGTRAVPSLRYLRAVPVFQEQYRFIDGDVGPIGGFTWDGRAASLHEQARIPLLAANEMANAGPADVARKLRNSSYAGEFRAAFGADIFRDPQRAFAAGLEALETFEQTPKEFYPYSSRYDQFLRGEIELTEQEERGVALFKDPAKGNCASCHLGTTRRGVPPPFTDYDFANVGVPRNPRIAANTDPKYYDLGLCGPLRQDMLKKQEYCGFFRSPTVRNTAIREVYFHNGAFTSLREVLHFYNERDLYPEKYYPRNADGSVHRFDDLPAGYPDNIDHDPPLDRKPGAAPALTEADIDDLIAFLRTLVDADVATGAIRTDTAAR